MHDETPAERPGCREPHNARYLMCRLSGFGPQHGLHRADKLSPLSSQPLPIGGDAHLSGTAVEKRLAEPLLQDAHRAGHDLRRDTQTCGRLPEAGRLGGGTEHSEQFELVQDASTQWNSEVDFIPFTAFDDSPKLRVIVSLTHEPSMSDFLDLQGKSVLVTGASSGMGAEAALAFANAGARLVLGARREVEGEAVAQQARKLGAEAVFVQADMTREGDIKRLVETALQRHGRLDVAFNNAGTGGNAAPFTEQTVDNYDLVMDTNVKGVFLSMKHEIAAMLAGGGGAIVNNASMGALIGFQNLAPYIASKHAVMGLTKTAALEYFPKGIRINAVLPGLIDTPFQDRLWGNDDSKYGFANGTIAGRIGTSEEVADLVLFLASKRASFMSGQGVVIDGGYTAQ